MKTLGTATRGLAIEILLVLSCVVSVTVEPSHGNVVLGLEGGLTRDGEDRPDIEIEFPIRDGMWPESAWGYSMWFCRDHHEATVLNLEASGNGIRLALDVRVVGDPWTNGGEPGCGQPSFQPFW
jgi:hypothetical protein